MKRNFLRSIYGAEMDGTQRSSGIEALWKVATIRCNLTGVTAIFRDKHRQIRVLAVDWCALNNHVAPRIVEQGNRYS